MQNKETCFGIQQLSTGSLFLFVTYQSIFLNFVLFLTCEGTPFLRIKPLNELVEEQLEDKLTLFFEPIFAYVPVNVEFLFFLF